MVEQEVLNTFRGKHFEIINWYFYRNDEENEITEIKNIFNIPEKYKIIGRCTLLGDIVVLYKNKIGVISHDEPEEGPLIMVKDIIEFGKFVRLIEEIPDFEKEKEIINLKKIRKKLKKLKKIAPKNLRDDFENSIYDVEDIIEDLEDE